MTGLCVFDAERPKKHDSDRGGGHHFQHRCYCHRLHRPADSAFLKISPNRRM